MGAEFGFSNLQHRAGEIDADHPLRPALAVHRREGQVGRARAEIEHGLAAGQLQHLDGLPAPSLVESGAEQMVQQIVALGNRIKHARNTGRILRGRYPGFGIRDSGFAGVASGRHKSKWR